MRKSNINILGCFLLIGFLLAAFLVLISVNFVSAVLGDNEKLCPFSDGVICLKNEEICCDSSGFPNSRKPDICINRPDSSMCGSVKLSEMPSCQEPSYSNSIHCLWDHPESVGYIYPGNYVEQGLVFSWIAKSDCEVVNLPDGTSCAVDEGTENEESGYCRNGQCIKINPEVTIKLDEEYIEKTKEERLFRPKEITPFEDIVCEIKLESFLPDLSFEFFEGKLITTDSKGEETLLSSGTFSYLMTEGNYRIFGWKIKGWPDGITNDEDMEKIIENKNIKCIIEFNEKKYSDEKKTSNCVHLYGADKADLSYGLPFKVVNIRTASFFLGPSKIVDQAESYMEKGFKSSPPFSVYPEKFSHYVDLVKYDDSSNTNAYFAETIPKISSCGDDSSIYIINSASYLRGLNAVAYIFRTFQRKVIFINSLYLPYDSSAVLLMHEVGHSFCGITDEYMHPKGKNIEMPPNPSKFSYNPNCVEDPFYSWGTYGDNNWKGCLFTVDEDYGPVNAINFYRPSKNSIMNVLVCSDGDNSQFNVVSCGYCLQKIKEDSSSLISNWQQCCDMNNVIKPEAGCPIA